VPSDFTKGIIFPIPKGNSLDATKAESYRGISVSCVLSKLFEARLLKLFGKYLYSNDLQFGFKAGVGCNDAILSARSVIRYYTERGSTVVTLCLLDISKAFDSVDFYCLFLKLMNRQLPRCFISVIAFWYTKSSASVRWGDSQSSVFDIHAGV